MDEARKMAAKTLDLSLSKSLVLPKYMNLEAVQQTSEGSTIRSSKGKIATKMQLDLINLESSCNSPIFSS